MSGNCNADTCNLKACRLSATINSLGCPQSSTEHEFNRAETHDSYTTRWDTIGFGSFRGSRRGALEATVRRFLLGFRIDDGERDFQVAFVQFSTTAFALQEITNMEILKDSK